MTLCAGRIVEVGFVQRLTVYNDRLSQINFYKNGKLTHWMSYVSVQQKIDNQGDLQIIFSIVVDYQISTPFLSIPIPFDAHTLSGETFIARFEIP